MFYTPIALSICLFQTAVQTLTKEASLYSWELNINIPNGMGIQRHTEAKLFAKVIYVTELKKAKKIQSVGVIRYHEERLNRQSLPDIIWRRNECLLNHIRL